MSFVPNATPQSLDQAYTVLVVDDELDLCALYQTALQRLGYQVLTADSLSQAKALLSEQPNIDCVVSDYRLADGTGIELAQHVAQQYAGLPLSIMTAYGSPDHAVQALKAGVFDYLTKPVSVADLRATVAHMLAQNELRLRNAPAALSAQIAALLPGESPQMQALHKSMANWVNTQACLVLQGEHGTGKELAARAIHASGLRAAQPFIVFNCEAYSAHTLPSALFGVQHGSLQGAYQQAQHGTLLIEEIGAFPLDAQLQLLNTLQERSVRRVGAQHSEPVDVRLMVSSTQRLDLLVQAGKLRQDLFYRLNIMALELPALRQRDGDAVWLTQRWLARHALGKTMALSQAAQHAISAHRFEGNIRELENTLERSVALASSAGQTSLDIVWLSTDLNSPANKLLNQSDAASSNRYGNTDGVIDSDLGASTAIDENSHPSLHTPQFKQGVDAANHKAQLAPTQEIVSPAHALATVSFPIALEAHLAAIERELILQALKLSHYNRTQAAQQVGLSPRQLRYRIELLGIED